MKRYLHCAQRKANEKQLLACINRQSISNFQGITEML